jgi:diadenosine tetraphosphate (Ap4A) HIT family hydrolase
LNPRESAVPAFELDPRLAADSLFIADLPLSQLRLMNDARFPWLVLVPRLQGAVEWVDLPDDQQAALLSEINRATRSLRDIASFDKLNIGALGNIVRQLHVHVVARRVGDAAWPGPAWGSGPALPYDESTRNARIDALRLALPEHTRGSM